jgi:hypothetical protein
MSNKTEIKRTISRILTPPPAPVVKPAPAPVPAQKVTYTDKIVDCAGCGIEFVWEAGDQAYYARIGMTNPPRYCAACRKKRRAYFAAHPEQDRK